MSSYSVRARRWAHGWELHIDGDGVTQVVTLDKAEAQVRDYLATVHDRALDDDEVTIVPELGGIADHVAEVRAKVARVQPESLDAAEESRAVARELREYGLSVTDTAAVLGVSRGRVSQLVR